MYIHENTVQAEQKQKKYQRIVFIQEHINAKNKTHAIGSSKEIKSELSSVTANRAAQLSRSLVSTAVSHIGQ